MINFISISNIGSIHILNIPLGVGVDYVKNVLRTFDIQENDNCLYVKNASIDSLPPLNIHFNKDKDGCIDRRYIGQSNLNQKECEVLFKYFKKHLYGELNVFSEKEDEIVLTNSLHRVNMGKQKGVGTDDNKYPFFLHISGKLMGKNEPELKYSMKQLYLERGIQAINKPNRRVNISQAIKVLFLVLALIVAFLFALNGRYAPAGERGMFIDKWTKTLITPNDDGKYERY